MIPVAPRIVPAPTSGLVSARSAAARARSAPSALPTPSSAVPAPAITARTSAKSRLIRPGTVIISLIPPTAERKTSLALEKASISSVECPVASRRRSFGIASSASTSAAIASVAASAVSRRRTPSKPKGSVTTPTVSAPSSRAMRATTGAAPEPVPPPMPAATKTMSDPSSAARISSFDSSAAARATEASPPAPSPRVLLSPIRIRVGAIDRLRSCASVLIAMKSTPASSALIIELIALPPPPPTPTTRMIATGPRSSSFL